jgi:hypothetical protein
MQTFYSCSSLTSIPAGLFSGCTAVSTYGFYQTFYNCTSLTTIPTDLFRYNTAVSTYGFRETFSNCTSLTSIPTDLFRYNTAVSAYGFYQTFYGCVSIETVPEYLFRYNTAVSTSGFYRTFYRCNKAKFNKWIFYASGETSTRFLNRESNFRECFYTTCYIGAEQGEAPDLWNCDFGTGALTSSGCFGGVGNNIPSLSNYKEIPIAWK